MEKFIKFIATFGGLGYSTLAPGTTGSLGGAAIYLLLKDNVIIYTMGLIGLLAVGFFVSGRAEDIFKTKDPKQIVIDEVCGLLLALYLLPFSYANLIIIFLIFRTIDVMKPFPIRRLESLKGSLGIMGDDILAAIYTNLIFRLALIFFSPK